MRLVVAACAALLWAGCLESPAGDDSVGDDDTTYPTDPLGDLPDGADQLRRLCERGHHDSVALAFCAAAEPPPVTSLRELEQLLGIDPEDSTTTSFAMTGHSSSLVVRLTSPVNPRAIIFSRPSGPSIPAPNETYTAMGFVRGEQFVELAGKDAISGAPRFFLFRFRQECNGRPEGCGPGDLLTDAVERGFTEYTLYDDGDLANTTFDCLQCHQPDGPATGRILRMQERALDWTHWFLDQPRSSGGNVLLCDDFIAARSGETYAGIPYQAIVNPSPVLDGELSCRPAEGYIAGPFALETFLENNGFADQPNEFPSAAIFAEVTASNPLQPAVNEPPGVSATWQGLYQNYVAGRSIPPPYHDHRITDAGRLRDLTAALAAVRTGAMPPSQLPAIDVLLEAALPDMAIRPQPGASGRDILIQMCQQCHNSRLDQSLSRANFNVERLDAMTPSTKRTAIERIRLPKDHAKHMPPVRFRELSEDEIARVEAELSQ